MAQAHVPHGYTNRMQAGEVLAKHLLKFRSEKPLVLALPRGGVPVAAQVATALDAPLDVLVVRKIGAPSHEEYGIGAIAPGPSGVIYVLNTHAARSIGATDEEVSEVVARETAEMRRRMQRYRGSTQSLDLRGRTVLLVDDGLATGVTATAAARAAKACGASRVILAVPVAAPDSVTKLQKEVDEVVAPLQPHFLGSVGFYYDDFSQTEDVEVEQLLAAAKPKKALGEEYTKDPPNVQIRVGEGTYLQNRLELPASSSPPTGCAVFVHGSGSGMESPRNRMVAETLHKVGLATLLVDLLTEAESRQDAITRQHRFNIMLLCDRTLACIDALINIPTFRGLPIMLVGSSTGAAGALMAAAQRPDIVGAVVSRGGRVDLAADALPLVRSPTLLIVGSLDQQVLEMNQKAMQRLKCPVLLEVIPNASHLFSEQGTLETAALLTTQFLEMHTKFKTTKK